MEKQLEFNFIKRLEKNKLSFIFYYKSYKIPCKITIIVFMSRYRMIEINTEPIKKEINAIEPITFKELEIQPEMKAILGLN